MQHQIMLNEVLDRPVAFLPGIAKAVGSINLGIMISQLVYWSKRTTDPDGWIFKTQKEWYDETALSRREQDTARKVGKKLAVLEEKLAGNPARLFYRVNVPRLYELLEEFLEKNGAKKPKERVQKGTETIMYFENIPEEDIAEITQKYGVTAQFIKERADDVITYCQANGRTYSDYKAALINFIKTHNKKNGSKTNVLKPKEGKYANFRGV